MKSWHIKTAFLLILLLMNRAFCWAGMNTDTLVQTSDTLYQYDGGKEVHIPFSAKIIPNQCTIQYAGSVGLISVGVGWHYGKKDDWETEVLLGIVPKYHSSQIKASLTFKQRYVPFRVTLGSRWCLHPLTTGFYFNSIFGEGFWASQPSRYPKSYYGFATKVRAGVYAGSRIYYKFSQFNKKCMQGIALYYELGAGDLQLVSALPNKRVKLGDILSLALGVTIDFF